MSSVKPMGSPGFLGKKKRINKQRNLEGFCVSKKSVTYLATTTNNHGTKYKAFRSEREKEKVAFGGTKATL